jgi:hypothetical protein
VWYKQRGGQRRIAQSARSNMENHAKSKAPRQPPSHEHAYHTVATQASCKPRTSGNTSSATATAERRRPEQRRHNKHANQALKHSLPQQPQPAELNAPHHPRALYLLIIVLAFGALVTAASTLHFAERCTSLHRVCSIGRKVRITRCLFSRDQQVLMFKESNGVVCEKLRNA